MIEPTEKQLSYKPRRNLRTEVFSGGVILAFVVVLLWAERSTPWTGLADKTFWDWLDLLVVPLALALVAVVYSWAEKNRERELAKEARKEERRIALDDQQERSLLEYYAGMKGLLLEYKLRTSEQDSEVRAVAQAQTHAVLRRLDTERKGSVLLFLYDAGLLKTPKDDLLVPFLNLKDAPLIGADLSWAEINSIQLPGVDLSDADLSGVLMKEANLQKARLENAIFKFAQRQTFIKLETPDPSGFKPRTASGRAAILDGSDFTSAKMSGANLQGASLVSAILSSATLMRAVLVGANLSKADLKRANLSGADLSNSGFEEASLVRDTLSRANLDNVDFTNADLTGADLQGATNLDKANLNGTVLTAARLPEGFVVPHGAVIGGQVIGGDLAVDGGAPVATGKVEGGVSKVNLGDEGVGNDGTKWR